jgi:hypothetical protein
MRNRLRYTKRDLYADLLNVEYLLGLISAFLLGASKWIPGVVCLILTLGLGRCTCKMYWRLQDQLHKKKG